MKNIMILINASEADIAMAAGQPRLAFLRNPLNEERWKGYALTHYYFRRSLTASLGTICSWKV